MKEGLKRKGQSLAEYAIVAGIIAIVLASMGTGFRRSVQSVIKEVADVMGFQHDAEQASDPENGYLVCATTDSDSFSTTQKTEATNALYATSIAGQTAINTQAITNLGVTNVQD